MPFTKQLGILTLLAVFLVGCDAVEPAFRQTVSNEKPTSLCLGGLRGMSGTTQVKGDTGVVAYGQVGSAEWNMPQGSPTGTPVILEAWCYGENDEELAYLKLTRGYRNGMNPSISTLPPTSDTNFEDADYCMQPREGDLQRGPLICIMGDF